MGRSSTNLEPPRAELINMAPSIDRRSAASRIAEIRTLIHDLDATRHTENDRTLLVSRAGDSLHKSSD